MTAIDQFIEDYKKNVVVYERLAQVCAQQCESELKRRGLRTLVTHRAKRLDSLTTKVVSRSKRKGYQCVEDIYQDIVDLAGVRIALYFPGDRDDVDSFLHSYFDIERIKEFPEEIKRTFPYEKRFSGYVARHYRLRLKKQNLDSFNQDLAKHVLEVQVGSVLMHAWAEVEHDLVYKSKVGPLSQDEYAILDELNGLMHAGEIALERLQRAVKRRINTELQPFSNHYELSSFLYDYSREYLPNQPSEPFMGRTDILFEFLQKANLNSVPALNPILEKCKLNAELKPLAAQIIDHFLQSNPDYYQIYNEARLAVGRTDPFGAPHDTISYFSDQVNLGYFIQQWIILEGIFKEILPNVLPKNAGQRIFSNSDLYEEFQSIRKLRNDVLFGNRWPSAQEIQNAGFFLRKLIAHLRQRGEESSNGNEGFFSSKEA